MVQRKPDGCPLLVDSKQPIGQAISPSFAHFQTGQNDRMKVNYILFL